MKKSFAVTRTSENKNQHFTEYNFLNIFFANIDQSIKENQPEIIVCSGHISAMIKSNGVTSIPHWPNSEFIYQFEFFETILEQNAKSLKSILFSLSSSFSMHMKKFVCNKLSISECTSFLLGEVFSSPYL